MCVLCLLFEEPSTVKAGLSMNYELIHLRHRCKFLVSTVYLSAIYKSATSHYQLAVQAD